MLQAKRFETISRGARNVKIEKIEKELEFPERLQLPSELLTATNAAQLEYELCAVVVHVGAVDSGHYYTYAHVRWVITGLSQSPVCTSLASLTAGLDGAPQTPCGWCKFNDGHVTEVSLQHVQKEAPYMFLYAQCAPLAMCSCSTTAANDGEGDTDEALRGQTTEDLGQSSADEMAARLAQTPPFLDDTSLELHLPSGNPSPHNAQPNLRRSNKGEL
jgi:hypothetical protein